MQINPTDTSMQKHALISVVLALTFFANAQEYQHSVGVNVGGTNGISYKGLLPECNNWYITADINTTVSVTQGASWAFTYMNPIMQIYLEENAKAGKLDDRFAYWTLVGHPNFIYQGKIKDFSKSSLYGFVGPGISFGMMQYASFGKGITMGDAWRLMESDRKAHSTAGNMATHYYGSTNPYGFKLGINASFGFELCLHNAPINIGFDFRPGWGCYMKPYYIGKVDYIVQGVTLTDDNAQAYASFSFFDWSLGLTLRYRL